MGKYYLKQECGKTYLLNTRVMVLNEIQPPCKAHKLWEPLKRLETLLVSQLGKKVAAVLIHLVGKSHEFCKRILQRYAG